MDYLPQETIVNAHDLNGSFSTSDASGYGTPRPTRGRNRVSRTFAIVGDKLRMPEIGDHVGRSRLTELLERSKEQAGVTLLCGRSGTGKTVVAADFAAGYANPVWYTIEPADTDWDTFSNYFAAALCGNQALADLCDPNAALGPADIAEFISRCMRRAEAGLQGSNALLVLDNLHHLYDSDWFPDFFNQLILSRGTGIDVLMLCRTKPPLPLWRLRSKQMLNVIDENVLGFTQSETLRLCDRLGVLSEKAAQAHLRSSGRISKLIAAIHDSDLPEPKGRTIA